MDRVKTEVLIFLVVICFSCLLLFFDEVYFAVFIISFGLIVAVMEYLRRYPKAIDILSREDYLKYSGQHVCLKSLNDNKVISADADLAKALAMAKEKGFADPVVIFVPRLPMADAW